MVAHENTTIKSLFSWRNTRNRNASGLWGAAQNNNSNNDEPTTDGTRACWADYLTNMDMEPEPVARDQKKARLDSGDDTVTRADVAMETTVDSSEAATVTVAVQVPLISLNPTTTTTTTTTTGIVISGRDIVKRLRPIVLDVEEVQDDLASLCFSLKKLDFLQLSATSGQVYYVAGHDATGNEERNGVTLARRHIGFCPQVDPLLDLMTARETLQMYGRLRGISLSHIDGKVESLLEQLSLTPHAHKPSQNLLGGNKRKLSLGIALIGDPKILLIDESSSGMDPLSKRRMWNLIAKVSKNKTVIVTTHSMEEAEALCTRAGIMAKGQLLCLGSVQHLKTKYLDGYTIDVFCNSGRTEEEIDIVVNEMLKTALPGCKLAERYGRFLRFDVPSLSSLGLGTTFRHMQALKTSPLFCVENYSISQCSLEQVFVKLVEQVTLRAGKKVSATISSELDSDIDEDDDEEDLFLSRTVI